MHSKIHNTAQHSDSMDVALRSNRHADKDNAVAPLTQRARADVDPAAHSVENGYGVAATGIRKRYGKGQSFTDALVGVDLHVRYGEVVGVLGPNGAGKTTLIEILEGLRSSDAGTALVLGTPVVDGNSLKPVRHRIGVCMQHTVLPPLLKVEELFHLHTALYAHHLDAERLVEAVGLSEKRKARVQHLSGGQQQRVAVALALIGDPDLLFLDEPTSTLDPQARRAIWELIENQKTQRNAAVLITTHQMEEAQRICDRVVILDHGKVLAEGAPTALIDRYCPARIIEFVAPCATVCHLPNVDYRLEQIPEDKVRVRMHSDSVSDQVVELMTRQARGEITMEDFRIERQTLEDVFLNLTGRRIRE